MGNLILNVLPYGLAAALAAPAAAVVTALILGESRRPLASAATFIGGAALLDAVFIGVSLALAAATGFDGGGDAGAIVDVVLGVLFLALGLLAIFSKESPEKRPRSERASTVWLPAGSER
jgi:hypothetical protein